METDYDIGIVTQPEHRRENPRTLLKSAFWVDAVDVVGNYPVFSKITNSNPQE